MPHRTSNMRETLQDWIAVAAGATVLVGALALALVVIG
jgi:hypothetical protein